MADTASRSKTSIPVPKVWEYSTTHSNAVGAPYILMDYIHGTVATELRRARSCPLQMFGTPEQDQRFREQMAEIQATVASFRFAQIGSLYHNPATDEFYIGPELQTGRGPWGSSTEYYDDLVNHLLHSASAKDELKQSQSFMLPSILGHLIRIHGEEKTGPFRLTNRDFGAHNILVNENFESLVSSTLTVSWLRLSRLSLSTRRSPSSTPNRLVLSPQSRPQSNGSNALRPGCNSTKNFSGRLRRRKVTGARRSRTGWGRYRPASMEG